MANHNTLTGAELHEPKGANTALLGQVFVADGAGSGAFARPHGTNTVVVNSLADLPAPSGGKIALVADTNYIFAANITSTDFFQAAARVSITSNNFRSPTLTYSGTGSMFVGVDVDFQIHDIRLDCPTAQVFDFSESGAGGTCTFRHNTITVDNCTKWGTFEKMQVQLFENSNSLNCADGITILGNVSLLTSVRQLLLAGTSTTFIGIDFGTSVHSNVELIDFVVAGGAGSIGVKGAAASANMAASTKAVVAAGNFLGVTTPLSVITADDVRWKFGGNAGIVDTAPDALLSLVGNSTPTVIAAVDTPVLVAGTWIDERSSHFTNTTAGRATHDGELSITSPIDGSVTLDVESGINKDIRVYIAIDGIVQTGSGKTVRVDSGAPKGVGLVWQEALGNAQFVEIFVENKTDALNITVIDANLRVR